MARIDVAFVVESQQLTQTPITHLYINSQDSFYATFSVDSAWSSVSKIKAIFTRDGISKTAGLTKVGSKYECEIPWVMYDSIGDFQVSLYDGSKMSTNSVTVGVNETPETIVEEQEAETTYADRLAAHFSLRQVDRPDTFKIDGDTRVITPPESFENFGVESDENASRVWFEVPQFVGADIDLSTLNLYVNFQNANGEKDKYIVEDASESDGVLYFSWLVSRKATRYKGDLTFIVCAIGTDENGDIETEWNTTLCTGSVLEGLEVVAPIVPEETSDLINQLVEMAKTSVKSVESAEAEALAAIAHDKTMAVNEVLEARDEAVDYISKNTDNYYASIINETVPEYIHSENYMPPLEEFTNELLNASTGAVSSSSNNKLSPFFEVPAGKKFIAQHFANAHPTYAAIRTFAPYDAEKNIIASSVVENAPAATIYDIPPEAKYLRICLMKGYINNFATYKTMFVVNDSGTLLTEYVENTTQLVGEEKKELQGDIFVNGINLSEDAHKKIKKELGDITDDDLTKVSPKHKKSARVSALSQMFTSYESTNEDYIAIENTYLATAKKTEWLYGCYDALMAEYPDYITRTQIGTTASPTVPVYSKNDGTTQRTDITSSTVFPIYRYDFKPPIAQNTITNTTNAQQTVSIPKILYTTGIHGGEYRQVIAAYRFFKMLCEKWADHDLLSDLRWNVHFVVVPLSNPFGFNFPSGRYDANGKDVSKRNERNIDISGNFPSDNYVENEGSEYKYGTQPLTEPGSIALYDIITNEDFILSVDNHTFNYLAGSANTNKMAGYFITNKNTPNNINFWFKISRWMNQRVRKLSPDIDKTYDSYDMAQVWVDNRQQMLSNTFRSIAANIEMTIGIDPTKEKDEDGKVSLAEETQAFCVDELAVVFYEALQDFHTY